MWSQTEEVKEYYKKPCQQIDRIDRTEKEKENASFVQSRKIEQESWQSQIEIIYLARFVSFFVSFFSVLGMWSSSGKKFR